MEKFKMARIQTKEDKSARDREGFEHFSADDNVKFALGCFEHDKKKALLTNLLSHTVFMAHCVF